MAELHLLIHGEGALSLESWRRYLVRRCQRVTLFHRVEQAVPAVEAGDVNALILLAGGDDFSNSLETLRRLRDRLELPILVIADVMSSGHAARFLDAGADDFLAADTDAREVLARVRCKCRRSNTPPGLVISAGGLMIDMTTMEVRWQGLTIHPSAKELLILKALASQPYRVFTKAQLEQILYGAGFCAKSNTIQVFIHALRKMTHRDAILTVRGVGYCLGPAPA
ncbi:response regulator transcription factor [Salinicola sp. JS01]|uniref:response regulator transcription factor n=1 Tax=Salinicola sp. JS01 TaxID=3050071 RepID=UPI00255B5F1E|nr:response regulator transcription factor [Salinicola sp. JS01]WIX34911.1 response regulator transcription factor [Salinicola sp. JS01]